MSTTSIEFLVCPECGGQVSFTVRQNGFRTGERALGPPVIPCPQCGTFVETGKHEWDQKSGFGKAWFFATRFVWWLVGSALITVGAGLLITAIALEMEWIRKWQRDTSLIVCYSIGMLLMAVLFIRGTAKEIRESRKRAAEFLVAAEQCESQHAS